MRMICVHEFFDVNKNMHTLFNVSIGDVLELLKLEMILLKNSIIMEFRFNIVRLKEKMKIYQCSNLIIR